MPYWDPSTPTVRSRLSEIDDYIREAKQYLEDALGREHVFSGENKGRHIPGKVPVVYFTRKAGGALPPGATHYLIHYTDTGETYYYGSGGYTKPIWTGELFPRGTRTIFFQQTSPPGWVIVSGLDDALVYITRGDIPGIVGGTTRGSWTITGLPSFSHSHTASVPSHIHIAPFGYNSDQGDFYAKDVFGSGVPEYTSDQVRYRIGIYERRLFGGEWKPRSGFAYLALTSAPYGSPQLSIASVTITISHNGTWRPPGVWGIICERQ